MSESVKAETTTLDCLKQFSSASGIGKSGKAQVALRKEVCKLLGVNEATGRRWFGSHKLPNGDKLLRLRLLLHIAGYVPSERQGLWGPVRELGDYLAMRVVTLKDAHQYTGVSVNSILRWMTTATSKPLRAAEPLVESFLLPYRGEANRVRAFWRTRLEELGLVVSSVATSAAVATATSISSSTHESNGSLRGQMIDSLAHLILAAKPLAQRLLSDDFTAAEREQLRQKTLVVRHDGVFDLANMLNRLCSERARNELSQ